MTLSATTCSERVWERWRPLPQKELSVRRVQDGFAVLDIHDSTSIPNDAKMISADL